MPVNPEKSSENWNRFIYCRDNGHADFLAKAQKCDSFTSGDQWLPADLQKLKDQSRPAITINKILSTVANVLGEQIKNRTEVLFRPKNGSPSDVAEALTKIWMHLSQENQLPWVRSDVFFDGTVRSRGFYDVRMKFDDAMQGEVEITQLNSKNVVIDPDAEGYDPDSWNDVFISKWLSTQDISILYSEEDGKYLADRDQTSFQYGADSLEIMRDRFGSIITPSNDGALKSPTERNIRVIERQYRKLDKQLHFVDIETGDMRAVPADWDRERIGSLLEKAQGRISTTKKLVKRIRWCVTADNVLLHDDWSPYRHFTVVPYFPYFRYGKTVGIVENLLGPQEILNKVSSQELHIVNTTANSGWVLEANSLVNMSSEDLEAKGATTGLVLEFAKGTTPPQKIQPNQTPTGLDRISYKAEEHIKSISGVSDSMQGFDREDVAAKAIAYKTQRGSMNLVKVMDNLERTDYILARNCLSLIQEYYTEPRILNIINPDITAASESVEINQVDPVTGKITNDLTMGEYDIVITTAPYRASLEDSQFQQALEMRREGIPIPDSVLIENSRLQRRAELVKQMTTDKESPEAQAAAELQRRGAEAEVANKEADTSLKQAQAGKTAAEATTAQNGDFASLQAEQVKLNMERERMQTEMTQKFEELQMKNAALEQQMELKRRDHEQNTMIRADEAARKAEQDARDAAQRRQLAAQKASGQSPEPSTNSSV